MEEDNSGGRSLRKGCCVLAMFCTFGIRYILLFLFHNLPPNRPPLLLLRRRGVQWCGQDRADHGAAVGPDGQRGLAGRGAAAACCSCCHLQPVGFCVSVAFT